MAGKYIVMKNESTQITGDCKVEGYKDWLILESIQFGTTAALNLSDETGSVHQTSMNAMIPFGPWVAELQQRLFHGQELGTVTIVELQQQIDADAKTTWKKVRELKLEQAWVEAMSHSWSMISATVSLSINYSISTFSWADKVAVFTRNNDK